MGCNVNARVTASETHKQTVANGKGWEPRRPKEVTEKFGGLSCEI